MTAYPLPAPDIVEQAPPRRAPSLRLLRALALKRRLENRDLDRDVPLCVAVEGALVRSIRGTKRVGEEHRAGEREGGALPGQQRRTVGGVAEQHDAAARPAGEAHLRDAVGALATHDVVLIAAEDGGYVLIGARAPHPELFVEMTWSVPSVLAETRARIAALGLTSRELPPLWDVDTEDDLARMEREFPELAL